MKANTMILTSSNDSCLLYGKELLQRYLVASLGEAPYFSLDGVTFSLVLSADIPHPSWDEKLVKTGSYCIQKEGDVYVFYSKSGRGILNAVISYLEEEVGVCFYTAEEEYVPSLSSLPLPKVGFVEPLFSLRNFLTDDTYQMVVDEDHPSSKQDFMVKAKTADAFTPFDAKHGGEVPFFARGLFHNFHFYCPYEVYGKTHPEFFRLITVIGKNMATIDLTSGIDEDGNLIETDELTVAKIVLEELKKDVIAHPEAKFFSLTQEDGDAYFDDEHNRVLEKKYKRSGILIRFCNAIVRSLHAWAEKELGRDIKLVTFAYSYTQNAPVQKEGDVYVPLDPSVIADPNLYIMLACSGNAGVGYFSPKQDEKIQELFRSWSVIGQHFWFWAYDMDFANYCSYFDSFDVIADNIKGFAEHGIDYLLINSAYDDNHNWQANLKGYLYRRLMWNPSLDPNALRDDYLNHYYGPLAPTVKKVMSLFHENYVEMEKKGHDVYFATWGTHVYPENIPLKVVNNVIRAIEEGETLIDSLKVDENIKNKYRSRLFAVKVTPLNYLYLNFRAYYPGHSEEERIAVRKEFLDAAVKGDVKCAREYFSFEAYVDFVESEDYKIHPIRVKNHLYIGGQQQP